MVKVRTDQYRNKYLVLLFYPFDFTYVCPTEIIAFSEAYNQIKGIGADILGISVDSVHTHMAWIKTPRSQGGVGQLNFPLFADVSRELSNAYGVLVNNKNDELHGAALRGLFIVDGKNKIRHMQITDASVGRDVNETIRLIKAFQYTDTHGEVCPAGWKEGDKTIKPDQELKKEFFKETYTDPKSDL